MGRQLKFLRRPFVVFGIASATLMYLPLGMRALARGTEARYAEVAREMWELGEWLVPHLHYVPYLEKPPLMYWLTALSMGVFGAQPFGARFWCAGFGLLTLWITYQWGRHWKSERVGLLAASILATSTLFFAFTQYLSLDMALTFWTTCSLAAGSQLIIERSVPRARRLTYALAIGIAGGVLTKGLVGLVLPLTALISVYGIYSRRLARSIPWKGAAIVGLALIVPWFALATFTQSGFLQAFFVDGHLSRFLNGRADEARQPFFFYAGVVLVGFLPWVVFLPKVLLSWLDHRQLALRRDPEAGLMFIWTGLVLVFFSLSQSKLVGYILPIIPTLALLVAQEFEAALDSPAKAPSAPMPTWISGGLVTLILLSFLALILAKIPNPFVANLLAATSPVDLGMVALTLGVGIFLWVGVWGMRHVAASFSSIMIVQILILATTLSLLTQRHPARRFERLEPADSRVTAAIDTPGES